MICSARTPLGWVPTPASAWSLCLTSTPEAGCRVDGELPAPCPVPDPSRRSHGLHLVRSKRIAATAQVLYGLAASASVFALLARRAWLEGALAVWTLTVTLAAILAPIVWGGAPWTSGAVSGVATLVVAALVSWGALAHLRDVTRTGAAPGGPPLAPRS
jgi:hypothetical protein